MAATQFLKETNKFGHILLFIHDILIMPGPTAVFYSQYTPSDRVQFAGGGVLAVGVDDRDVACRLILSCVRGTKSRWSDQQTLSSRNG